MPQTPPREAHPHHPRHHDDAAPVLLSGSYRQPIFSPRGGLEGLLLDVDGAPVQVVLGPDDAGAPIASLAVGQALALEARPSPPSPKGEPVHAVYRFHAWPAARKARAAPPANAHGRVTRYNYARHGEPNGVVLDNGDFIHLRPEGFRAAALTLGDEVTAEGVSQPMPNGGRVIEATRINGMAITPKPPKPPRHDAKPRPDHEHAAY